MVVCLLNVKTKEVENCGMTDPTCFDTSFVGLTSCPQASTKYYSTQKTFPIYTDFTYLAFIYWFVVFHLVETGAKM